MRRLAAVLVMGLALSACQSPSADPAFELRDWSIEGPSRVARDVSTFIATNTGTLAHTLVVTANDGTVIAATDLIQPGETIDLDVGLYPGMFQVSCRIVAQTEEGELMDHYELGMRQTVEATES